MTMVHLFVLMPALLPLMTGLSTRDIHTYSQLMCQPTQHTATEQRRCVFNAKNMSCSLASEETIKNKGHRNGTVCLNKYKASKLPMQMRCVMCTDIPGGPECEQFCQMVNGHIVCSFMGGNKSCVFTTNLPTDDCNVQSDLLTKQQQLHCSKLSKEEIIKVKGHSHLTPGDTMWMNMTDMCSNISRRPTGTTTVILRDKANPRYVKDKFIHDMDGAITFEKVDRVRWLLLQGLESINCRLYHLGRSPIMMAVQWGKANIVELLLGLGADLSSLDSWGNNLLHIACMAHHTVSKRIRLTITKRLVALGLDVEGRNRHGFTPLLCATSSNNRELVDYLVDIGVNVTAVTHINENIFHIASEKGADIVECILSFNIQG